MSKLEVGLGSHWKKVEGYSFNFLTRETNKQTNNPKPSFPVFHTPVLLRNYSRNIMPNRGHPRTPWLNQKEKQVSNELY